MNRVLILAALAASASAASAGVGDLWAITGAGGAKSDLYRVDKGTGATTFVGNTGFGHVTGLAFDPTSGTLYGHVSDLFVSGATQLITIDTGTGAGTLVGSTGTQSPDMDFDASGQLYAWSEAGPASDGLVKMDKTSGATAVVGSQFWGTALTGLGFDTAGTLWLKNSGALYTVDTSTGDPTFVVGLSGGTHNALDFDPTTGRAYSIERRSGTTFLRSVDTGSGSVGDIGDMGVGGISALAFEIPAPSSLALLGLGGFAAARRRRA